jgi:hypothetical protein
VASFAAVAAGGGNANPGGNRGVSFPSGGARKRVRVSEVTPPRPKGDDGAGVVGSPLTNGVGESSFGKKIIELRAGRSDSEKSVGRDR